MERRVLQHIQPDQERRRFEHRSTKAPYHRNLIILDHEDHEGHEDRKELASRFTPSLIFLSLSPAYPKISSPLYAAFIKYCLALINSTPAFSAILTISSSLLQTSNLTKRCIPALSPQMAARSPNRSLSDSTSVLRRAP